MVVSNPTLSHQLPGGGWSKGVLVALLVQQPGVGEMRLLAPALWLRSGMCGPIACAVCTWRLWNASPEPLLAVNDL